MNSDQPIFDELEDHQAALAWDYPEIQNIPKATQRIGSTLAYVFAGIIGVIMIPVFVVMVVWLLVGEHLGWIAGSTTIPKPTAKPVF